MIIIIFHSLSAHLEKHKTPQAYHKWFLINCDRFLDYRGPRFRSQSSKPFEVFSKDILSFTLLCGATKDFMKAFKAFIKPFEAPQRNVKIKIEVNFLSLSGVGTGKVKISQEQNLTVP